MLLAKTDNYLLRRDRRFLFAAFRQPHRVLSTCPINGGLREDLTHLANHQSCEGVGHCAGGSSLEMRHVNACHSAGLPPTTTALMSTAANMQCAVLTSASYAELTVQVAASAGVLGNATRAGDVAHWHEQESGSVRVTSAASCAPEIAAGTIVTLVFINQPCSAACLVKAALVVTEAKASALLDLRIPSLQSQHLATGTGTDQLGIAAPLESAENWARRWAGSHNTLGELLARATHQAITRCLLLQNGLCAELRRSICAALGRHGCDEEALRHAAAAHLDADTAQLFNANLIALLHDPQSAAAAYALAETIDLTQSGILHMEVASEALLNQAALLAASVAVQPQQFATFRTNLAAGAYPTAAALAATAVVLGFAAKWQSTHLP